MTSTQVPGWEDAAVVSGPHAMFPRPFGRYLLLRRLAHGGMGEVCVAKATGAAGIEKLCIVKTLRADMTHDAADTERFVDEARTVVQLSHRNVCQVFDVGEVGGRYYIAMELVLGQNLRVILDTAADRGVRIHPDVGIHVIADVLEALDYAHGYTDPLTGKQLRVVHRDVSPQNIMVSNQGEVKLIDFGIAVSTVKQGKTDPSVILGKVAYLSHEQAIGTHIGPETDQYAAAVCCYEVVSGERFYESLDAQQMLDAAATGDHVPRRMHELDEALQLILKRALSSDSSARFPTCGHFREALLSYQEDRGVRVDVRHIRQLMVDVFGDDQVKLASELQRLAAISAAASSSSRGGTEPTRTIATKMRFDADGVVKQELQAPDMTTDDGALPAALRVGLESTQVVDRARRYTGDVPPPPAKRSALTFVTAGSIAAVLVALSVVSLVVVLGRSREETPPLVVAGGAPTVDPVNGTATPPSATDPIAPIVPVAVPGTDAPSLAPRVPVPTATPTPTPTPTPKADRDRDRPKKKTRAPPKATGSLPEKLSYLKDECPTTQCARAVLSKGKKLQGLSIQETVEFKKDLDSCVQQCR